MHGLQSESNNPPFAAVTSSVPMPSDGPQWYALQTRPRHEKRVATELQEKGITTYVPLLSQVHHWSDRRKVVHVPLFSCYAFVHARLGSEILAHVYGIRGALGFVGVKHRGLPIPETQIENIRILLTNNIAISPCSFLRVGQRVRIRGGALDGVEGIVSSSGKRLVISVETISHSLSISLEGQRVEPV